MKYLTVQEIQYVGPGTCEPRLEPLMDALLDLEEAEAEAEADETITDPDLAANVSTSRVDVQITVDAENPAAAIGKALATLRTAIHATGNAASGWETSTVVMHVAPADAADRLLART